MSISRKPKSCGRPALSATEPDRETSGLLRVERIIREIWSDPIEQQEVFDAYQTISRSLLKHGRADLNQWLHERADYLEGEHRRGDDEDTVD